MKNSVEVTTGVFTFTAGIVNGERVIFCYQRGLKRDELDLAIAELQELIEADRKERDWPESFIRGNW